MRVIFFLIGLFIGIFESGYGLLKEDTEWIRDHDGKFKLFRVVPEDRKKLEILSQLYQSSQEFQLDFWKPPTAIGAFIDIMVPPEFVKSLQEFFTEYGISSNIIIEDVQKLILQREKPKSDHEWTNTTNPILASFFRKRMKDDNYMSRNRARFEFGDYHSYNEMIKWMTDIVAYYPHMAKLFTIGTTHEGRPITGIQIGNPISDTNKRIIWLDGGMHAREWAAIHTALYFIDQLIANYGIDPQITDYVNTLNFYILPVANPDGFEYSRSEPTPTIRFWRKNRGPQVCKKDRWRRDKCCGGVDLNRNFDFHWGESGSSDDLCSDIFQGTTAFSEPESRAIRDKILSPELYGKVDAFITLHTYSQMWIHPYSHERNTVPNDIQELKRISEDGVRAIENMYGTKYRFGTGADMLYPSAGGSDDWAKSKAQVKYVYLLELRPGEEKWDGFLLDRRQLLPTGRETWEGVKVVINAVMNRIGAQRPRPIVMPPATTRPPIITTQRFQPPWTTRPTSPPIAPTARIVTNNSNRRRFQALRSVPSTMNSNRNAPKTPEQFQREREYEIMREQQRRQLLFWQSQQRQIHGQPQCADRSQWCANWIQASPNICRSSSVYMREDCARSCGFCT